MSYYNELVTVYAVRSAYLGVNANTDDALLRELVRSVCADMERSAQRSFTPRIATRYFDYRRDVEGAYLWLDADLLAVNTLTNGDGATIASNAYVFEPRNLTPYYGLKLLNSSGVYWAYNQDSENAIAVAGVWGCHTDYANAWTQVDTLGAAMANTSATTATLATADSVRAGDLVKIGSEILYIHAASGTNVSSLERGANGSTAATHAQGDALYVWTQTADLVQLAREGAAARYRLRDNPLAEQFTMLDGTAVSTPKDVSAYIEKRLRALGYARAAQ